MKLRNLVLAGFLATSCGGTEEVPMEKKSNPRITPTGPPCDRTTDGLVNYCGSRLCNEQGLGYDCEYSSQETADYFFEQCEKGDVIFKLCLAYESTRSVTTNGISRTICYPASTILEKCYVD
jgi:hypothetical protein